MKCGVKNNDDYKLPETDEEQKAFRCFIKGVGFATSGLKERVIFSLFEL